MTIWIVFDPDDNVFGVYDSKDKAIRSCDNDPFFEWEEWEVE